MTKKRNELFERVLIAMMILEIILASIANYYGWVIC